MLRAPPRPIFLTVIRANTLLASAIGLFLEPEYSLNEVM